VNNNLENNLTDKHLVDKVLHGDHRAFATIIRNTEGLVAQMVFKMVHREEDRQDIAQDIYLKVFHKLSGFRFQSKLSTWIGQIAYHTCLSYLEKKKWILPGNVLDEIPDGSPSFHASENTLFLKERAGILQAEMEKLPPMYRVLIGLYHQEELSYQEIMQITGQPEGTLKSYLFRARRALKDALSLQYKKGEL
jgi:RNA polymerase sigma factor (sigma-70 family)